MWRGSETSPASREVPNLVCAYIFRIYYNQFTKQIRVEECTHRMIGYGELPIGGISGEKIEIKKN